MRVVLGDAHRKHLWCGGKGKGKTGFPRHGGAVHSHIHTYTDDRIRQTHLVAVLDAQLLVDLELDGQAVAVPPEAAHDMVAPLVRVARHRVLDGPRQQVPCACACARV